MPLSWQRAATQPGFDLGTTPRPAVRREDEASRRPSADTTKSTSLSAHHVTSLSGPLPVVVRLATVTRTQGLVNIRVNGVVDGLHRPVAEQEVYAGHVKTGRGVGIEDKGVIRQVRRAAVSQNQSGIALRAGKLICQVRVAKVGHYRSLHRTHPCRVGHIGAALADEQGVTQAIGDVSDPQGLVANKGPVVVIRITGNAIGSTVHADVAAVGHRDGLTRAVQQGIAVGIDNREVIRTRLRGADEDAEPGVPASSVSGILDV